jgi:hypothetical protein
MHGDHALLELAARAAGIPWPQNISAFQMQYESARSWNPLADDGDALRLAVKLRMSVNCLWHVNSTTVQLRNPSPRYKQDSMWNQSVSECHDGDPAAATRRAIVRAAAEIGKAMQEATAARCTCPSGDGSLAWPCPDHPLHPPSRMALEPR